MTGSDDIHADARLGPDATIHDPELLMQLAAYVDGRLDDADRARVERRLREQPELLPLIIGGSPTDEPAMPVSIETIRAATALVTAGPARRTHSTTHWLRHTVRGGLAAAACIAVAVTGYRLGQTAFVPSSTGSESNDALVHQMTFGVFEDTDGLLESDATFLANLSRESSP